jgi:diguanylate cyclase (GGDEF)-like protein
MGGNRRSALWDAVKRTSGTKKATGRAEPPGVKSLNDREAAVASGELAVLTREESAGLREEAAGLREELATLREQAIRVEEEAAKVKTEVEGTAIVQLREANEHLVLAGVRAQTMAEEAEHTARQMSHAAQHDFLTDLPNRLLLNDRLTQAIALGRRHRKKLAVLFFDVDRFKHINDSLGHPVGDKLLQSIAQRAVTCVRSSDAVSRQGGDEFLVLLSEIEQADDAARCAEKLLVALTKPHSIDNLDLHITVSIGISIYPQDGQNAETLIKSADTAMYHAKENGRNNYQFFTQDMNARVVARQSLETGLRSALERREFVLHYQPKVDLGTGAVTGAEALIRWQHPERGLVLPADFVPIAEECGLIVPIGRWVVDEACRQSRAWLNAGTQPVPVAVNISAVEFRDKGFVEGVLASLKGTSLDPSALELELTESVLMHDAQSSADVLHELKAKGVQLAVDDFGTGYSSLSYLSRFPVDALKIDQSFVHDITTDPSDATIVTAVINMAKGLNLRVIAEGIETVEQLAFLRGKHCGEGQGYHFSRPVTGAEFANLVGTSRAKNLLH